MITVLPHNIIAFSFCMSSVCLALYAAYTLHKLNHLRVSRPIKLAWRVLTFGIFVRILSQFTWSLEILWAPLDARAVMPALINNLGSALMLGFAHLSLLTARDLVRVGDLERAAHTDPLTGVLNRAGLAAASKAWTGQIGVIVADLDHFKRVNDRHGHPAGDFVLRSFVERAKMVLPANGQIARLGGEEFAVVLPAADVAGTSEFAERIRRATKAVAFHWYAEPIRITVSLGVSAAPSGADLTRAIARADAALYGVKRDGRNAVRTA